TSPHAKRIADARNAMPAPAPWPARFEVSGETVTLHLENFQQNSSNIAKIRFYPGKPNVIENPPPQLATSKEGGLILRMTRSTAKLPLPKNFEGVLAFKSSAGDGGEHHRLGYRVNGELKVKELANGNSAQKGMLSPVKNRSVSEASQSDARPQTQQNDTTPKRADTPNALRNSLSHDTGTGPPSGSNLSFGAAVLFAFLGGLILNLMPCVFPVLSLKALSLTRETAPHERHIHASAYLTGVLVSFAVLATVLIVLRAGGDIIGWGTQFQSPAFVLILMALFMALGLNMSGVFELGGRLAGVGDKFTHIPGFTGYFFTGVLATVVATPCTAPFMGTAIGYAFTQPAPRLIAVLLMLGVGFALPMVVLSYTPAIGRWLPKPGPWMATFKGAMAFLLYATVGWLLWVLSVQLGSTGVLGGLIALLGVAFAAWLVSLTQEPHPLRSGVAVAIAVAAIWGGATILPAPSASGTAVNPSPAAQNTQNTSGLTYEPFSTERLTTLRVAKKPVFVNLTAAWCITCKVNERVALSSSAITEAFAARGIVLLKGDWTNANPEITAILQKFGRAGVPLYLLYSGDGGKPKVFPQLLTESIVMDGLTAIPLKKQAQK
ncbi:MAG: thioredoxin family protein, partial [Alphaproteobacteria bacterium]